MSHTPGPWAVAGVTPQRSRSVVSDRIRDDSPGNHCRVALVYSEEEYSGKARNIHPPQDECEANARLIAAAPDMLRCLKWFVSQFQGDSGTGDSHWEQFEEYLTACRIIERLEKEQRDTAEDEAVRNNDGRLLPGQKCRRCRKELATGFDPWDDEPVCGPCYIAGDRPHRPAIG